MNVDMIRGLAQQHKALKTFHAQCRQDGAYLDVITPCPEITATLCSPYAALIMPEVRQAVVKRISETEAAIKEAASG